MLKIIFLVNRKVQFLTSITAPHIMEFFDIIIIRKTGISKIIKLGSRPSTWSNLWFRWWESWGSEKAHELLNSVSCALITNGDFSYTYMFLKIGLLISLKDSIYSWALNPNYWARISRTFRKFLWWGKKETPKWNTIFLQPSYSVKCRIFNIGIPSAILLSFKSIHYLLQSTPFQFAKS